MPWKKMRLRDDEVFVRVDDNGAPRTSQGGLVEVRYRLDAQKTYRAAPKNLTAVDGAAILPDEGDATRDASPRTETATKRSARSRSHAAVGPPAAEGIIVYADGACSGNPGPAGLGMVLIDGPRRIERSEFLGHATNNIAELIAVQRALEAVDDVNKTVTIHTDSAYSIGVLTQGWKAKANRELIAQLRGMLAERPNVRFVHVRGHAGIVLNERADALARRAVNERTTVETEIPTSPG